jgi:biotin transport system substrate-specific component
VTMGTSASAFGRRRASVLADLAPGTTVLRDLVLVLAAAAFVGVLAQLSVRLPFTPVPVTGQTLGVLVAGTALGWRRGALALALYGVAGLAGVPWFAGHAAGFVGVNFGYVLGFVLSAALAGWLAGRGADRSVWRCLPAMVVADLSIYLVGVPWLALWLHVDLARALALGFVPFLIGDGVKALLASGLLPAAWRLAS